MNNDDQAFARSLARLRPAKAELDPAALLYQAGFAAGEAGTKLGKRIPLQAAALALLVVGLAAGGGFYAGHQRGERAGYLAAAQSVEVEAIEKKPIAPAPQIAAETEAHKAEVTEPARSESDAVPRKPTPSREPRIAIGETLGWAWLFEQLAPHSPIARGGAFSAPSPLAIGTMNHWEDLSDFRKPPERPPQRDRAQISYPYPHEIIEPPRNIRPTNQWLQTLTGVWGINAP